MDDLNEFLLDRIAEDETAASAATPGPWHSPPTRAYPAGPPITAGSKRDADHIARWDPSRVLAECEAKRRIVERQQHVAQAQRQSVINLGSIATEIAWTDALRYLALPYADHPDYREEWRP